MGPSSTAGALPRQPSAIPAPARPSRPGPATPSALATDAVVAGVYLAWLALTLVVVLALAGGAAPHQSVGQNLSRLVNSWDGAWYRSIAASGYQWNGDPAVQQNVNFLPGYPLAVRAVHALGLGSYTAAEVLVASACQLASLLVLARLFRASGAEERQVRWAAALAAVYPAALFSLRAYATSMCALAVAASVLAFVRGRRGWAFAVAGLASAVEPTCWVLPLALAWAEMRSGPRGPGWLGRLGLRLAAGYWGLAAYCAYLWARFGSPAIKFEDLRSWVGHTPLRTMLHHLVTLSFVPGTVANWVGRGGHAYLADLLDVVFLLALAGVVLWLASGEHGLETTLAGLGGLLVAVQAAQENLPVSVIRLSAPFWMVLPMHPRVRAALGRLRWLPVAGAFVAVGLLWCSWWAQLWWTN